MIEYKGYTGVIVFDPELRVFTGHVVELRDEIYFEGDSVDALEASMQRAVDHYLSVCQEAGRGTGAAVLRKAEPASGIRAASGGGAGSRRARRESEQLARPGRRVRDPGSRRARAQQAARQAEAGKRNGDAETARLRQVSQSF